VSTIAFYARRLRIERAMDYLALAEGVVYAIRREQRSAGRDSASGES
jgi:hypothetical protein